MIVLYDDATARSFEPFATTRPLGEMRAGALLVRERWQIALQRPTAAFAGAAHLDGFAEFDAPPPLSSDIRAGSWIVNTRALPFLDTPIGDTDVIRIGGRVAAVRTLAAIDGEICASGELALETLVSTSHAPATDVDGVWLNEVWDVIATVVSMLQRDIPALATLHALAPLVPEGKHAPVIIGAHAVYAEAGAIIEPLSVFDTTAGPVLVRARATVQAFTRIIGPCYIGHDSVVMADRIAASSIGEQCRVHGELSTSVLVGYANKGHDGFVGHSVFGRWVNLGAGTITSNLKNTYGTVSLWTPAGVRDSGLQFLGTMFGDHVKTGIGLQLTTGCVLGAGANVFDSMPPKSVAPFSWGAREPYASFDGAKFVDTAAKVMARRSVVLQDDARAWLLRVHRTATAVRS